MEKRFKISSQNMGFIATGNDITSFLISTLVAYVGGRGEIFIDNALEGFAIVLSSSSIAGHRPRWMAFGVITIVIYCLMNVTPHFLYGAGDDALSLTVEHGAVQDDKQTKAVQESRNRKLLCQKNG